MTSALTTKTPSLAPMSHGELTALALAADPETAVDDDAPPLDQILGSSRPPLLPEWYMPAPMGTRQVRGWRRQVVVLVILSFLVITAAGLCNTYGQLHFG